MEYKNEILIIAEFMGLKYRTDCSTIYPEGYFHKPDTKEDAFPDIFFSDLQYHKSWDLLMLVVEKIEAIDEEKGMIDPDNAQNYHVLISKRYTRIIYNWNHYGQEFSSIDKNFKKFNLSFKDYRHSLFEHDKLKSTYQAVIDFIQWYNLNQLNQK